MTFYSTVAQHIFILTLSRGTKMTCKLPPASVYFSSLFIAAAMAGLLYWILQIWGLDTNGLLVLGLGLFIGHLLGTCIRPPTKQSDTASANRPPTPANGDTLSLYVGNLAYRAQRDELEALFAQYGDVKSVRIMLDRATRRPRGYAFVEMEHNAGRKAMEGLDGVEFCGRTLRVSEAKQRQ